MSNYDRERRDAERRQAQLDQQRRQQEEHNNSIRKQREAEMAKAQKARDKAFVDAMMKTQEQTKMKQQSGQPTSSSGSGCMLTLLIMVASAVSLLFGILAV